MKSSHKKSAGNPTRIPPKTSAFQRVALMASIGNWTNGKSGINELDSGLRRNDDGFLNIFTPME
jgi:hypothetical protein